MVLQARICQLLNCIDRLLVSRGNVLMTSALDMGGKAIADRGGCVIHILCIQMRTQCRPRVGSQSSESIADIIYTRLSLMGMRVDSRVLL